MLSLMVFIASRSDASFVAAAIIIITSRRRRRRRRATQKTKCVKSGVVYTPLRFFSPVDDLKWCVPVLIILSLSPL